MDRNFASAADLVAQWCGAGAAFAGIQFGDASGQVGHGGGCEVMIVGDRPGVAMPGNALEQLAYIVFAHAALPGDIAHTRGA